MPVKAQPDINDTLRESGEDAVRARHDTAQKYPPKGNGSGQHQRFKLTRFEEITMTTAVNYLVKGVVPREGMVVIWGPPKCGKSFLTLDLAINIALGWKYRGRKVKQGAVVYLALDGGGGFGARVEAWRQKNLGSHKGRVP